jgi:hypothetical protein
MSEKEIVVKWDESNDEKYDKEKIKTRNLHTTGIRKM